MKTPQIVSLVAALSLVCVSVAEGQSEATAELEVSAETEIAVQEPAPEQAAPEEPVPVVESAPPETHAPVPVGLEAHMAESSGPEQVRLRFRAIRLYAGAELQMAPVDAPSSFETMCELPCNTDVDVGVYHLNVHRLDGRDYALPTTMAFDADTRVSLKYGASTGAWVGGIVALTGILGILIGGGVAIAGAAGDNSNQTRGGLIGLGISSALFAGGLITFLLSERGLRAEVLESN